MLFSICGFTPQPMNGWRQWKVLFSFFWPQATWREVTLIEPLLMHRTMTVYTTDKPHKDILFMDSQYVANLVPPLPPRRSSSSLPPPLILPSGQRIREDLDTRLFPCVITISHRCPVSSCCHVVTFCRLCLHTLHLFFLILFSVLITEISLPTTLK